tara:strand:- start:874 stop:1512 length:639 start_codon:yes stop_codon:yes gene_type:complete
MKNSIVAGATGLVGSNILKQLAARGDRPVALARRNIEDLPANAEILEIDFKQFLINGELPHCNHLYLCLGTTIKTAGSRIALRTVDFDYAFALAKKARQAGATGLSLISSVGADPHSKSFYLRTKGQLEEAIKALGFASVNIYRPGILMGDRKERRSLEGLGKIIFTLIDPFLIGRLSQYRSIQADLLAGTMIENTDKGDGVTYFYFKNFNV